MTGTRPRRARQLTAVVALSLLLAALPAAAWADHGERGRGDQHRSERHEDRGDRHERRERRGEGHGKPGRHERAGLRVDAKVGRLGLHVDLGHDKGRRDDRRAKPQAKAQVKTQAKAQPKVQARLALPAPRKDEGFVAAASVQTESRPDRGPAAEGRGRDQRAREERARERREARETAARQRAEAREREAQERARAERARREEREQRQRAVGRNRLELDRTVWGASTEGQREAARRERELRRWLDERGSATQPTHAPERTPDPEPTRDEAEVVTAAPAPPTTPPSAPTDAAAAPAVDEQVTAPATTPSPDVDVLAHERNMVSRTFRAGGVLLRDTGRAVVSALPPHARTFSLPLGLLVAVGGYLVVQRRFRPGTLPMSAAAVPEQEGARERHRL